MLKSTSVLIKWNSKNKSHYEGLGYVFTKMKDSFRVNVSDLTSMSDVILILECDYCHNLYESPHSRRESRRFENEIKNDCCINCQRLKSDEIMILRYGTKNAAHIDKFRAKAKETNLERYGYENPFSNKDVQKKIRKTNFDRYGNESFTKTDEYLIKSRSTSLEKYGETNWMKTEKYKKMFSGENSPVWKGGVHDERWDRLQPEYKKWRQTVFLRDGFICQKCNAHLSYLEVHHIENWNVVLEKRYLVENGITFCLDCHIEFHRRYGKKNNTLEQILEFVRI